MTVVLTKSVRNPKIWLSIPIKSSCIWSLGNDREIRCYLHNHMRVSLFIFLCDFSV
ncbi:hypothetical protein ES332_A13G190800v1 [Gossypium tomentosum]|uniref:Uncharacterized protein n=1 Tax=Gossypium tomentosum TaxID=34277 RepID=A0A5D2MM06_GOSTO|nr:hypothetical protein ES332_A13G190800v1 [Gossypium tomentosum]